MRRLLLRLRCAIIGHAANVKTLHWHYGLYCYRCSRCGKVRGWL